MAIVGHTGAGKTTIISLLCRFYEVQRGQILVDGIDIRQLSQADLRRHIAVVLQDVFLFSGSIAVQYRPRDPAIRRRPDPGGGARWSVLTGSSSGCRRPMTRKSRNGEQRSRSVRSSSSRSPVRWRSILASWSWTKRPPALTPRPSVSFRRPSANCSTGGPRSSSRTGSPPSSRHQRSLSCTRAKSAKSARTRSCLPSGGCTTSSISSSTGNRNSRRTRGVTGRIASSLLIR